MPHIIAEISKNLAEQIDIDHMLNAMHNALANQNGIAIERIKTRAILLDHYLVGANASNTSQNMLHITLKILEGRDIATKKSYGQAVYNAAQDSLNASKKIINHEKITMTLDIRDMVKETYIT